MADFDYRKFLKENKSTLFSSLTEGQFSWMTHDTDNQIGSEPENTITVYMHDDKGNTWKEDNYEGYGEFGGMDYYELVDKMNGGEGDRSEGIRLAFDDTLKGKVLFPALTQSPRYPNGHDFTEEAKNDPNQSWYNREDDDYNDWEEEEDDNELYEAQEGGLDVASIAQQVADEFTKSDELDLKYVVTPGSIEDTPAGPRKGAGFDLDVEAGPNTPGEDWKDENGFGIDNYLGHFAGGSFTIKPEGDGYVVRNAAMKNAVVGYVTPEGELDFVRDQEQHYDNLSAMDRMYNSDEWVQAQRDMMENKKSNKMKKSELKEMIKAAMLAEYEKDVNVTDENPENEEDFLAETQNSEVLAMADMIMDALGAEKFVDELISAMSTDEAKANLEHIIQMWDLDGGLYEAKDEEVDVEADAEETETDSEETTDVAVDSEETIDTETTAEINPDTKVVQDALTQAMEAAKKLGDKKLEAQIGNTITFFTRAHIAGTELDAVAENTKEYYKDAEADDAEHIDALEKDMADDKASSLKIGEVMFPMWTKLNK